MACGLALLASGQAFATNYYSTGAAGTFIGDGDLTSGTKWFTDGCTSASTPAPSTISMGSGDIVYICGGHSLNLSAAVTFNAGTLFFNNPLPVGTWGGNGLKFGAGNKKIYNQNSSLPSIALNVSSMTTGNTITIAVAMAEQPVTFSSVTGGSLVCGGNPYTVGNPIAVGTTCTVTVSPPPPTVSAPIFSTQEKPAVFSEEVK